MNDHEVLELFILYYPTTEEHITDQVFIGDGEYMFYIDDGGRVRFDIFNRTMLYIKPRGELTLEEMDDIWTKEFSRKLKRKLDLQKITQKELAQSIGVTDRTVHRYIHEKMIPNYLTLRKIANALNCTIEELTNFDYLL